MSPLLSASRSAHLRVGSLLPLLALAACGVDPLPGSGDTTDDTGQAPVLLGLGSLEGQVQDAAGAPVAGALITTDPRGYSATTDADGSYRIDLLPPDDYQVYAAASGWLAAGSDAVAVQAEQVASADVVLSQVPDAGGRVQVSVLGPDGAPAVGATVSASTGASGLTDADGRVTLEGVWGEGLSLSVQADRTWGRSLTDLTIVEGGGLQWQVQLSGRQDDSAIVVGSTVCGLCHEAAGAAHGDTLHARAHATEPGEELTTWFQSGEGLELGNGATAALSTDGLAWQVQVTDSAGALRSFDVAGFIGDPDRATVPWTDLGEQGYPLPLAFHATAAEREGYPDASARLVPYQLDRWFNAAGRFALVDGAPDPATSAERACLACHVTGFQASARSDGGMDLVGPIGDSRFREDGVGCERCHGPGGQHTSSVVADMPFAITSPQWLDLEASRDVCGQCHARTHSGPDDLPWPWTEDLGAFRPGQLLADRSSSDAQHWPAGPAAATRMQLDELRLSAHGAPEAGSMTCQDCHDPHGASVDGGGQPLDQMLRLDPDDNSLCLTCHLDMDFAGDLAQVQEHTGHLVYDPDDVPEHGRCVGCHMPPTASEIGWSELSGAGDHASHWFTFVEPQATVDWFDDLGATSLDVGTFPTHGCADCHAWNAWRWELAGADFIGPHGDPTLRESHVEHQEATEEMWP